MRKQDDDKSKSQNAWSQYNRQVNQDEDDSSDLSMPLNGINTSVERKIDWDFVIRELEAEDDQMLLNYLNALNEPVYMHFDQDDFTLLHQAVLKGLDGKVDLILKLASSAYSSQFDQELFDIWLNAKTKGEGWTALHYASF